MPGLRPRTDPQVVRIDARCPKPAPTPPRRGWHRRRGPHRRAGTAGCAVGRPRAGSTGRASARSRNNWAARRRASSRSFSSVAPVRSASSASVSSGFSSSAFSSACSSIIPTSGEISSNESLRARSRRDVVFLRLLATSSSASSPSLVLEGGGDFRGRSWPQSGRSLFPGHPARRAPWRTPNPTARG